MIATWLDYSSGPVSGATLAAQGIPGVFRYVGIGSGPKRLTVGEHDDLVGHGRIVLGIAESTVTEADNGAPAGTRDAEAVLADPAAAKLPYVFLTNDKPSFITADVDYAAAFTDVLGARSSAYGFATFLKAVRAAGIRVSLNWQAGLPPNLTGTQGWVHFWQRQGTAGNSSDGPAIPTAQVIGGRTCDLNNQLLPLPGGTMDWTDPLANPLYNPAITDPADVRSHPAYTAAQYIQGSWVRTLNIGATEALIDADVKAAQGALASSLFTHEAAILAAVQGADSDTKAGILQVVAALAAVPAGGSVDVKTLAVALAPLLPAEATPQEVADAVRAELEAALAPPATPPTGGTA